ncbi:hypothetical protein [Novosphingobium sp. 9]|uniref:hypothetical protein n=1 Tax=Novosphingobium sp. 9 TaxID=2025349 RepID=UPI0021B5649F|nr:hypothetical protein [Novosphingobium sp. 9]
MAEAMMPERNVIRDFWHVSALFIYGFLIILSVIVSTCILAGFNPDIIFGKFSAFRKMIIIAAIALPILHFLNRRFSWKSIPIALTIVFSQIGFIASLGWLYP